VNLAFGVGRVWGTEVRAHWTWILLLAVITVFFGTSLAAQGTSGLDPVWAWGSAIATAALVFVSVTVHELAHAGMARRDGIGGPVVVVQLLGGSYVMELRPKTAGQEFRSAVVGPLVSLALAMGFASLGGWLELSWGAAQSVPEEVFAVAFVAEMLALFNGFLAVVNMLPGYPMDGARVVHAIAWARSGREDTATATASRVGRLAGAGIMLVGLAVVGFVDLWPGLALMAAGWLVVGSSRILDRRAFLESLIAGATVGDAADPDPQRVPAQLTLEFYASEYVGERAGEAAVVERTGEPVGLIGTSQIRRVPPRKWEEVRSEDAMVALDRVPRFAAADDLWPALEALERSGLDALVVEPAAQPAAGPAGAASGQAAADDGAFGDGGIAEGVAHGSGGGRFGLLTRRSAARLIHERAEERARHQPMTRAAATARERAVPAPPEAPAAPADEPQPEQPESPRPPARRPRRRRPPEPPAGPPDRPENGT
jgi:Zn-dependent protease